MLNLKSLFYISVLIINIGAIPKRYEGIHHRLLFKENKVARLSENIKPINYNINITLTENDLKNEDGGTFTGIVKITLSVENHCKEISIHAKNLDISKITKNDKENCNFIEVEINNLLNITCESDLKMNDELTFEYTGRLSTTEMFGFYQSRYKNSNNEIEYLAATQFEEMGARRVFPCFDEPSFKATFDISITSPEGYSVLSNTKQKNDAETTNTFTFETTPKMSTYLVAFIVSKFNDVENGIVGVWSRPGTEDTRILARDTALKALEAMKSYTNIDYNEMNLGKLSLAALPDFKAGAMENWGMTTYREMYLLWKDGVSSNRFKQGAVTVIAHELAHQWFGDLVTLKWWSDIFLNEGFATYFEYYAANEINDYKEWQLPKQFVIEQLQPVLVTDAFSTSLPLSYQTDDPDLIESRFDDISYNKGGSIIRMVESFIGEESFKKGLFAYLNKSRNSVVTVDDLWTSFGKVQLNDEISAEVAEIMYNWTKVPGYPLITVKLKDETTVSIEQERFLLSGIAEETKWYVPITYSFNSSMFSNTEPLVWLTPNDKDVTIKFTSDWIVLNNQQIGYYRVNYDKELLSKISSTLESNIKDIDEMSRSQLADDQINLARANKKSLDEVLQFLTFLKNDDSYYSWYSAFNGFSYLLKRTDDENIKKTLKEYILDQMYAIRESINFDTEPEQISIFKRVMVLTWLCNLEDTYCVQNAKDQFENLKNEGTEVDPDLKSYVYCNGLRYSEEPQKDYNFLWDKFKDVNTIATEQMEILKALGCVNNSTFRQDYLKKTITGEIRREDVKYAFASVYSNSREGIEDVLNFISETYIEFVNYFDKKTLISLLSTVGDLFTNQNQINKLQDLKSKIDEDNTKAAIDEIIKSAQDNIQMTTNIEDNLKKYFSLDNNRASINTFHFIVVFFTLFAYVMI